MLERLVHIPVRVEELEGFLAGSNVKEEQAHLDTGSRERMYWHYGYMMALKDVLACLYKPRQLRTRCCELGVPAGAECGDCPKRRVATDTRAKP